MHVRPQCDVQNKLSVINMCTQVAWLGQEEKLTWESSSSLPQILIDEFERGIVNSEGVVTSCGYGVTNHTLVVSEANVLELPPAKKTKKDLKFEYGQAMLWLQLLTVFNAWCSYVQDIHRKFNFRSTMQHTEGQIQNSSSYSRLATLLKMGCSVVCLNSIPWGIQGCKEICISMAMCFTIGFHGDQI